MKAPDHPLLVVVSAPSGAGKTTLCRALLEQRERMAYSVSCTTREPRAGEVDGEHYRFLDEDGFKQRIADNAFLEYARVHGAWYGTLRETVEQKMQDGYDVLMDIDVQGAAQIRAVVGQAPQTDPLRRGWVDLFIAPPSMEALRERLEGRAQDRPDVIERRLQKAHDEMEQWDRYRYLIVNDHLERALEQLHAVITAEHLRIPSS